MEKQNKFTQKLNAELEQRATDKLKNNYTAGEVYDNLGKRKYSEIFMTFIKPRIDQAKAIGDVNSILEWGRIVWNKAVTESYPNHGQSKAAGLGYFLFSTFNEEPLINEYMLRKHQLFEKDAFLIDSFETIFDERGIMSISMAVLPIEQ